MTTAGKSGVDRASGIAPLVGVLIFSACATGGLKLGLMFADTAILRHVYGSNRVERERLEIVKSKPHLVVSNGDVLKDYGFIHFLIACPLFLVIGAGGTACGMVLLPRPMRNVLMGTDAESAEARKPGCLAVAIFVPLSVGLVSVKPLWPNGVIVVLAIALAWVAAPSHQHEV